MTAPSSSPTSVCVKQGESSRGFLDGIYPDICLYALLLLACGLAFYCHWDLWEDQSAQVYMTWGMFHGMRPYVELVDPNWPGILLPHTLAYLLSGVDAWGLRAVDLLFLLVLLSATSWILAAWKTPRSLRILAGCAYLLNYFGTGWWWTAQRESFSWPIFVISAIPFLLQLRPGGEAEQPILGRWAWFIFGAFAGLSLWIKPVAWLALLVLLVLTPLLCDRNRRAFIIQKCCFFVGGIALVSASFIGVMAATGMLHGFIKWGIEFDLGPYSQVKWPWPTRLWKTFQFVVTPEFMPLPLLLCIVGCVMAAVLRLSPQRWRRHRRPLLTASALLFAGVMTALLQGKMQSFYHFLPMDWGIAFFAATIWSVIPWRKAFADAAMLLTAVAVVGMFLHGPARAGPTAGETAADRLRPMFSPQDQVVVWGYSPSLLARLQRRTPFQTFIGTSFLILSPPDSWSTREVLDRLNIALRDPAVRYLFVQHLPNFRIRDDTPGMPMDYLDHDAAIQETLRMQYHLLPDDPSADFQIFAHSIAPSGPPS